MNNSKLKYWPLIFLIILLEGIISLVWLMLIPSETKINNFIYFSYKRLLMMLFISIIMGLSIIFGWYSYRHRIWREKWLDPIKKPSLFRWYGIVLSILTFILELLFLYLRSYKSAQLSPFFIRLRPMLVYLLFSCVLIIIWIQFLKLGNTFKLFGINSNIWIISWICISIIIYWALSIGGGEQLHTWWYIQTFDQSRYERHGQDYCSSDFQGTIENQYQRANNIRNKLSNIDRPKALLAIFNKITNGAKTNTEKHLLLLAFIQKVTFHKHEISSYADGEWVYDPLELMELGDMWCTQGAILAIDLFGSAGYPGRLVQLANHQIAEIFYDGSWHYFDTDLFGNGETIFNSNGDIPSVAEMSRTDFQQIDSLAAYQEKLVTDCSVTNSGGYVYPSYYYFSSEAYLTDVPQTYYLGSGSLFEFEHGWKKVAVISPEDIVIENNTTAKRTPTKPKITDIQITSGQSLVTISFISTDVDNDLQGYQIFISDHSRGWDYNRFYGDDSVATYWANPGGWEPEMYENFFLLPPSNLGLIDLKSDQNQVTIDLKRGQRYFITVMPYDSYGLIVGRKLFPASNELSIIAP